MERHIEFPNSSYVIGYIPKLLMLGAPKKYMIILILPLLSLVYQTFDG